ncbi:MAG: hypothetical protein BAJATHORv1_40180 [Candidatus Thorarchaeota archaeon]|nr:MAG: hypothetical protein BAJATHORv1_40180 [Candidatus Thorarchaeota archaeon]
MAQICNTCEGKYSSLWKRGTKNVCSRCIQIHLLENSYSIFSSEARDALRLITKEIERLLDKQQEQETFHLLKKGLSYINGYLIHEADFRLLESGIYWYNEAMKKEDRLDSSQFIVDRTLLVGNTRFIIVIYLKKGMKDEVWKFFTGIRNT